MTKETKEEYQSNGHVCWEPEKGRNILGISVPRVDAGYCCGDRNILEKVEEEENSFIIEK